MRKLLLFSLALQLIACGQDVQFGKVQQNLVSAAAQTPAPTPSQNPNTNTPPPTDPPSKSPSTGLLACPAPDGISVCDPWIFIGWDDGSNFYTGYMRRRACNPSYDCRTLDHNGPCTQLNPLDEPGGELIALNGVPSCDYIAH